MFLKLFVGILNMVRIHPKYTKENLDKLERNLITLYREEQNYRNQLIRAKVDWENGTGKLSDVLRAEKDVESLENRIKRVKKETEFIKEARRTGKYPAIKTWDEVTKYESGKSIFYKDDPTAYSKSGCFIATAVYGDIEAPQVKTLRKIRNEKLSETKAGRAAIKFYYSGFGKKAAKYIQENFPSSIPVIKKGLDYLVKKFGN